MNESPFCNRHTLAEEIDEAINCRDLFGYQDGRTRMQIASMSNVASAIFGESFRALLHTATPAERLLLVTERYDNETKGNPEPYHCDQCGEFFRSKRLHLLSHEEAK